MRSKLRGIAGKLLTSTLLPFVFALVISGPTQASLIVNTGQGSGGNVGFGSIAWLAGEFTLNQPHYVTRVEGWLLTEPQLGGSFAGRSFSISFYGDGGGVPDTGNRLYTNGAVVVGVPGQVFSWEGYDITFGNGLELGAGTYWAAFEYRPGNGNNYNDGAIGTGVPDPLSDYAINNNGTWANSPDLNFAVRISGNPVPLPAPLTLLGLGLAVMLRTARKR